MMARLTEEQRAVRRVKRLDKKRREALPLRTAAGVIDEVEPLPTVREVVDWQAESMRLGYVKWLQVHAKSLRKWLYLRSVLVQYITWDQIEHIEHYCHRALPSVARNPTNIGARTDYYVNLLRELGIWWAMPEPEDEARVKNYYACFPELRGEITSSARWQRAGGIVAVVDGGNREQAIA